MSSNKLVIEKTLDGSDTLFVPALNEHYHSINGAVGEAKHIFLDAGLLQCTKQTITILEIGFGTGLNALLTALHACNSNIVVNYYTIEAFPVELGLIEQLNFTELDEGKILLSQLHEATWECENKITPHFYLTKINADLTHYHFHFQSYFDIIYFDAFSPNVQPEMWTQEIFDKMYSLCNVGAYLTTYCAKGVVRRRMQQAGFKVERLPGPPGKREMLRAGK